MQAMKKIVGLLLFNFHCLNDVRISQLQIRASIQEQIRMPIGKQIWSHKSRQESNCLVWSAITAYNVSATASDFQVQGSLSTLSSS